MGAGVIVYAFYFCLARHYVIDCLCSKLFCNASCRFLRRLLLYIETIIYIMLHGQEGGITRISWGVIYHTSCLRFMYVKERHF